MTWTPLQTRLAIILSVVAFLVWAGGSYAISHQTPLVCDHIPHVCHQPED